MRWSVASQPFSSQRFSLSASTVRRPGRKRTRPPRSILASSKPSWQNSSVSYSLRQAEVEVDRLAWASMWPGGHLALLP
jgi:hypothetical protein